MKPSDYIRRGWTQHSFARAPGGTSCTTNAPTASCWCLSGAILVSRATEDHTNHSRVADLIAHVKRAGFSCLAQWNDAPERTQAEVIAALEAVGL